MIAQRWLARADKALASAVLLLEADDPDRACSTAYYAMFYAARAALFAVGEPERALGKTHSGIAAAFSQFVVRPGHVSADHRRALSVELNRRLIADYEADGVDANEAGAAIGHAHSFVASVAAWVAST